MVIYYSPWCQAAPLVAQRVKNLPAMQETQVQSLSWEDPLEDMPTHSSILTWRIPRTEEPGGPYSPWSLKGLDTSTWWARSWLLGQMNIICYYEITLFWEIFMKKKTSNF